MGLFRKGNAKSKSKKTHTDVPPPGYPGTNGNSEQETLPEDFWDIDEPAVLGLFVGHYYELSIDTFFNASHTVVIRGKRGQFHTHSFRLSVRCRSKSISGQEQIIVDYSTLRERVDLVAQVYHNQILNELPPFKKMKATTENLTAVLFQQLRRTLRGLPLELTAITLWESPTVSISLTKDDLT